MVTEEERRACDVHVDWASAWGGLRLGLTWDGLLGHAVEKGRDGLHGSRARLREGEQASWAEQGPGPKRGRSKPSRPSGQE